MVGIVLVAHCNLAEEFLQVLQLIGGEVHNFCPVRFNPDDSPEDSLKKIADAVKKTERGSGVIILTDMFGGTPSNLSLTLLEEGKVEVVTGVNLPMLMKLANLREDKPLAEIARALKESGQAGITVASEVLCKK